MRAAIDAGDNAKCAATDQRGIARPLDGDKDGTLDAKEILSFFQKKS